MSKINKPLLETLWLFSSCEERREIVKSLILGLFIKDLLQVEQARRDHFNDGKYEYEKMRENLFKRAWKRIKNILEIRDNEFKDCVGEVWLVVVGKEIIFDTTTSFKFTSYDPPQSELEEFYSKLDYPVLDGPIS